MRFEQAEEGMRYVLPPRRNAASIIGVGLWLAFVAVWGVREFEKTSGRDPFLLPWAVFVPVVFFAWLRHVAGRELVTLALAALKIRRHVFGVGLTREYDASQIRNLRVAPPVPTWRDPKRNWNAFDHGMIAFEYGAKTVRFGAGVNQAKAATIVDEIKRHYGLP
jgi:hypothetical protein